METETYLAVFFDLIKRHYDRYSQLEKKISILENCLLNLAEEKQKLSSALEDSIQKNDKILNLLNANTEHQKYMDYYLKKNTFSKIDI